jgi:hypothetical protein
MSTAVTAVMIAYNNTHKTLTRLNRDLLPALKPMVDSELIVIDNSPEPSGELADAVHSAIGPSIARYDWQHGENLMYGPALNIAINQACHPYLLYVCTNHGQAFDPTWAADLLAPLIADDDVAMTGTLADAGPPAALGFPDLTSGVHIQGGVFAARTEVLRKFPYPDGQYAHGGSDLVQSFELMRAGWKLIDVPTVRSMWWGTSGGGDWKYVHERC